MSDSLIELTLSIVAPSPGTIEAAKQAFSEHVQSKLALALNRCKIARPRALKTLPKALTKAAKAYKIGGKPEDTTACV